MTFLAFSLSQCLSLSRLFDLYLVYQSEERREREGGGGEREREMRMRKIY